MSSINPSSFSNEHNFFPMEPALPEKNSVENSPIIDESSSQNPTDAMPLQTPAQRETLALPPALERAVHMPALPMPAGRVRERQLGHADVQQVANLRNAVQLQNKLESMSKGLEGPSLGSRVVSKGKKVLQKGWKNKGRIGAELPGGVGFLIESVQDHKEVSHLRKEVKALEKVIANDQLSKPERKAITRELDKLAGEGRVLEKNIKRLDKQIAKDWDELNKAKSTDRAEVESSLKTKISERAGLQNGLELLHSNIQTVRRQLYNEAAPDLDDSMAHMEQLVKEQKQVERQRLGHVTRGVGGAGYHLLTGGKIVSGVTDIATSAAALTPITAVAGLTLGTVEGTMHMRNIAKASLASAELKKIKDEGKTYRAQAWSLTEIVNDPTQTPLLRESSAVKAEIALAKADLIQDYVHNQKKLLHIKKVSNSLGLAESSALIAASSFSLASMIPEPATSVTMFSLAVASTGGKYLFMFSEFAYDAQAEFALHKRETKLHKRRDFDVPVPENFKGISKSFLGVEIRMAAMLEQGILPPGVQKYHEIIDEKGYIALIEGLAQQRGDTQAFKKGIMVISDFKEYSKNYYAGLTKQLEKLSDEKSA